MTRPLASNGVGLTVVEAGDFLKKNLFSENRLCEEDVSEEFGFPIKFDLLVELN
jgi:hypothetical protein